MDENDAHSWTGWPGAICLKCGCADPLEEALADGMDIELMPYHHTLVCPVKGVLKYDQTTNSWVLIKPEGSS